MKLVLDLVYSAPLVSSEMEGEPLLPFNLYRFLQQNQKRNAITSTDITGYLLGNSKHF